jgi:hypothetical protein
MLRANARVFSLALVDSPRRSFAISAGRSTALLALEHTHLGALEPIPALHEAVSPIGQLTLHSWSSLSFAAVHPDCAETSRGRAPKDIRVIRTSACLEVVRRISPSLGYKLATFNFLVDKALNLYEQKGLCRVSLFARIVHGLWAPQAGEHGFSWVFDRGSAAS